MAQTVIPVQPKEETKRKGFHLPGDVRNGIAKLAEQTGRTQSDLVTIGLREFLKRVQVKDA